MILADIPSGPLNDRDRMSFFQGAYLGFAPPKHLINRCVLRAYLDFNRTWIKRDTQSAERKQLYNQCSELISAALYQLQGAGPDQAPFDHWHTDLRVRLKAISDPLAGGNGLTVGQAQKWINMAVKYVVACGTPGFAALECVGHMPIDRFSLLALGLIQEFKNLVTPLVGQPWTKMDDDEAYAKFQRELRLIAAPLSPLVLEFRIWRGEMSGQL